MGGTCLPSGIYLCKGWVTGDQKFYRTKCYLHVSTRCFDRSMDRPRENTQNRQIKQNENARQFGGAFFYGRRNKMKRIISTFLNSMHLIFTCLQAFFADPGTLIPGLPKQPPYRGGVGHMKEWLPHSTRNTTEAPAININVRRLVPWSKCICAYMR